LEHLLDHSENPDMALRHLWNELRAFCKRHGISQLVGGFSLRTLGSPSGTDFPELASSFKASAVKVLGVANVPQIMDFAICHWLVSFDVHG
jgi:hypothetical protein